METLSGKMFVVLEIGEDLSLCSGGEVSCCESMFETENVQKLNWHKYVEGTVNSLGTVAINDPKQHLISPLQNSSL